MFESTPVYPDAGRYWRIVDDLGDYIRTAPTALRALAHAGNDWVKRYKRSSLRILGSVGEPINPETGAGTTTSSATSAAPSSTPGGRPRPAGS